jgi:hypothetical protein
MPWVTHALLAVVGAFCKPLRQKQFRIVFLILWLASSVALSGKRLYVLSRYGSEAL